MSATKTLFVAIDKFFNKSQNPKKLDKTLNDVVTVYDIAYSDNYPDMLLDVNFLPREDGSKYPVIFEIHGGGFCAGDKKYRRVLSKYFAKRTGAFVVNVNYGLGRKNAFPLPVRHLVAAVNFLVANADKYNLDLSRFAVSGDSAGGYYAALLCALQDSEQLQKECGCVMQAKFTAALFNCGLYDFSYAMQKPTALKRGICKEFTGMTAREARERGLFDRLSVTNYLTDSFPPSMVVYSTHDIFCKGQAERLLQLFGQYGVEAESICATKFRHNHDYNLTWKSPIAVLTNHKIINFLNAHLH